MPELRNEVGALTPKLLKLVHILEWVRFEEFVSSSGDNCGHPEHDRGMLANAFVAKAVLGLSTTAGVIERLTMDRALQRARGRPKGTQRQNLRLPWLRNGVVPAKVRCVKSLLESWNGNVASRWRRY